MRLSAGSGLSEAPGNPLFPAAIMEEASNATARLSGSISRGCPGTPGYCAGREAPDFRPASKPDQPRPCMDDRDGDPQLRLPGVRDAVRPGFQTEPSPANGR